ncbi:MAG: hypothetical protein V1755_10475 [Chloroflexota bacterium]
MDRAFHAPQTWAGSIVPIFLERFILAVLATVAVGVFMVNPLQWDRTQQVGAVIVIIGVALFVAGTVYRMNKSARPGSTKAEPTTDEVKTGIRTPAAVSQPVEPVETPPLKAKISPPEAAPAGQGRKTNQLKHAPIIQQHSEAPNSPNVVTLGPNSPVMINPAPPTWGLDARFLELLSRRIAHYPQIQQERDMINSVMGDPDSTRFAAGLVTAFRQAGWTMTGSGFSQSVFSSPIEGVLMKVKQLDPMPPVLVEVINTLREAGIQPHGVIDDTLGPGEFEIVVGSRPITR